MPIPTTEETAEFVFPLFRVSAAVGADIAGSKGTDSSRTMAGKLTATAALGWHRVASDLRAEDRKYNGPSQQAPQPPQGPPEAPPPIGRRRRPPQEPQARGDQEVDEGELRRRREIVEAAMSGHWVPSQPLPRRQSAQQQPQPPQPQQSSRTRRRRRRRHPA
jgi:hypothetical protein